MVYWTPWRVKICKAAGLACNCTRAMADFRWSAALTARGATVLPVTPYRYASQADSSRVAEAIHGLATGGIAMVAFTSSPQVERLAEVARLEGLEKELADGLSRALVASIGPIVTQTLKSHGVTSVIQPEASFHLKPLVRAIVTAWQEAGEKP